MVNQTFKINIGDFVKYQNNNKQISLGKVEGFSIDNNNQVVISLLGQDVLDIVNKDLILKKIIN